MIKGNISRDLPPPCAAPAAEIFETIAVARAVKVERIVSLGQSTPQGEWLSQEKEEWVFLVSGRARLLFEREGELALEPGDYCVIPAGVRHRVEWTDPQRQTVWLAVHYPPAATPSDGGEDRVQRVKVIRSVRRKKTAGARLYGGTLYVYVPRTLGEGELRRMIERFTSRFEKKRLGKRLNSSARLRQVAEELNAKYFGGTLVIDSIQYVTDQSSKFGCCNYQARTIRISHKVAEMPDWVRDYVVMHEICHLREHGHDRSFWDLVGRYPLAERAKGFLMAKGLEPDE